MRIREKASITVDICICLVMMNECGGRKITEKERIKRREKGKKIIHKGEKKLMEGKLINLI